MLEFLLRWGKLFLKPLEWLFLACPLFFCVDLLRGQLRGFTYGIYRGPVLLHPESAFLPAPFPLDESSGLRYYP